MINRTNQAIHYRWFRWRVFNEKMRLEVGGKADFVCRPGEKTPSGILNEWNLHFEHSDLGWRGWVEIDGPLYQKLKAREHVDFREVIKQTIGNDVACPSELVPSRRAMTLPGNDKPVVMTKAMEYEAWKMALKDPPGSGPDKLKFKFLGEQG